VVGQRVRISDAREDLGPGRRPVREKTRTGFVRRNGETCAWAADGHHAEARRRVLRFSAWPFSDPGRDHVSRTGTDASGDLAWPCPVSVRNPDNVRNPAKRRTAWSVISRRWSWRDACSVARMIARHPAIRPSGHPAIRPSGPGRSQSPSIASEMTDEARVAACRRRAIRA
jgi:hypothetical protein